MVCARCSIADMKSLIASKSVIEVGSLDWSYLEQREPISLIAKTIEIRSHGFEVDANRYRL